MLRQCVRLLIPGLIEFLAKMSPAIQDGSIIESHAAAVGEVWRAFAALFSITLEEHRKLSVSLFDLFLKYGWHSLFRTEAVRCFTPYHLPPLIQQLITAATYNINHSDFNNDPNDCATSLLCYHFAKCFQRSSWEIRCKYERAVGTFYKESYVWRWCWWCWRNWTGC